MFINWRDSSLSKDLVRGPPCIIGQESELIARYRLLKDSPIEAWSDRLPPCIASLLFNGSRLVNATIHQMLCFVTIGAGYLFNCSVGSSQ